MLPSHKCCPICNKTLVSSRLINKKCDLFDGKAFSYIFSSCSVDSKHYFMQYSSLYGEILFENIMPPNAKFIVAVNYVKSNSSISYLSSKRIESVTPIYLDRLLVLDYPSLDKIIDKANSLLLFT